MAKMNFNIHFYFLLVGLTIIPTLIFAQRFEVTPCYRFMFAEKVALVKGEINIKDNPNYGIIFDFELDRRNGLNLELSYDRLDKRTAIK